MTLHVGLQWHVHVELHGSFESFSWQFQEGSIGLVMGFVGLHRVCHPLSCDFVTPVRVSNNIRMPPN